MNFLKNLFYTFLHTFWRLISYMDTGRNGLRCDTMQVHIRSSQAPLCTYVHLLQVALERALGTAGEAPAQCGAGLVPVRAAGRARGARAVLRGRQEEADTAALTLWLYKVRRAY